MAVIVTLKSARALRDKGGFTDDVRIGGILQFQLT
jgi:hypothetical protein